MDSKSELREYYKNLRKKLPIERREEAEKAATEKLYEVAKTASLILSFASKDDELNLWPFNQKLCCENRLLLPRLESETIITPYLVTDIERELVMNKKWHVLEPDPNQCQKIPVEEIGLILVPGLAFDRGHGRLGYGKGHYDRFLTRLSCTLIGVGFKESLLENPFPHEKHDIPLTDIYLF